MEVVVFVLSFAAVLVLFGSVIALLAWLIIGTVRVLRRLLFRILNAKRRTISRPQNLESVGVAKARASAGLRTAARNLPRKSAQAPELLP